MECQSGNPFGPRPRGRWALSCRGELDDQLDGLDHGLNPIDSSNHLSGTKSRRQWKQARKTLKEI